MKAKTRRIIVLSAVIAFVLIFMIVATSVMYSMKEYMDIFLGSGQSHVVKAKTADGSTLDADYIDFEATSDTESRANAAAVTQLTAEEGMVLLKNKDGALPLDKNDKITILGYFSWHNNMAGGEDPNSTENAVSIGKGLADGFQTNTQVTALYNSASGDFADPASKLDAVKATFAEYSVAVITIKRNSGEGNDQTRDSGESEYHRTGLSINNAELKLVDYACKNFTKVILVINSANTMELGFLDENDPNYNKSTGMYTDPYSNIKYDFSKVVAGIWAGCCGSQGGTALARILKGEVNPSGHTPDLYPRNLRDDPTYYNFGNFEYQDGALLNSYADRTYFVEYEEGIYIGYRYYETAAYENSRGNYASFDYDSQVVYPFGYGLSYTTFSMKYAETPTFDSATNEYTFKVEVKNTGNVAGKAVAQIYVSAPWQAGMVEKAHVVLIGFGKTQILQPNATETLTIKANRDYFTSYDYKNEKCYILDKGEYKFYLSENSHSWQQIEMNPGDKSDVLWTQTLSNKIVYNSESNKRPTDQTVATNKMDDELNYKFKAYNDGNTGDGYIHDFTRENFTASFPTAPVDRDYVVSDDLTKKYIAKYDVWADENQYITEMPTVNIDTTHYTLADMRGVPIDDPKWDDYINQFTVESMAYMFGNGSWAEQADEDNGVPKTYDTDGPYGFFGMQVNLGKRNVWYCGGPMLAATFNPEIAKKVGEAFGEEAWQFKQNDGMPITGVYAYGCNTHRSAFGGRNYEYYSEDGVLAGKMGAAEASGASGKGLIVFMKHYALNDQETNRQNNGYCAWVNEQAFRENYIKPWELYMKEAKMMVKHYKANEETGAFEMVESEMSAATGIMTCYNRIGAIYGGASISINGILREEFGFTGTVLTDAGGEPHTYMTTDMAIRRGQNLCLSSNNNASLYDMESPTAVYWLKESTKHLLYNKANSNAMIGLAPGDYVYYDMSPWQVWLIVAWVVIGLAAAAGVAYIVLIAIGKIVVKDKELTEEELKRIDFDY